MNYNGLNMNNLETMTKARFRFDGDRRDLAGRNCILAVSVGQNYHEDEKLIATINLINDSGFSSCTVMLGDSLQRHNFTDLDCKERARDKAISLGDEWLERNEYILKGLSVPLKVIRWDDVLCSKDYNLERERVEKEYKENKEYQRAVNSTIFTFLQRRINNGNPFDIEECFYSGLEYLIEECPAIMPLWAKQGYDYIIYPQPMSQAMKATYVHFVKDKFDKAKWLSLRFKKKSNSKCTRNCLKSA